jgi:hypothetical protein
MKQLIYHRKFLWWYLKRKLILPSSLEQLSAKQFIEVAAILFTGGDELKCQVKVLKILSGISSFRFVLLKPEVINRAIEHLNWVFQETNVTKQLIPCYKGYHGPISGFDNLRMKEFHMSEMFYRELVSENPDNANESLNNLVAVLYRLPKKGYDKKRDPDGDIRIDFNHNELPFYSKKIDKWPLKVKQAIFLWYDGCRQELIDNNPMVFKEPSVSDFESQFDTGLYGVMRSLAGDKLGPVEKIESMYVHTAMLEIGMIKEEEKFIEQKMKAAK